jgi:hypothetical protein
VVINNKHLSFTKIEKIIKKYENFDFSKNKKIIKNKKEILSTPKGSRNLIKK